MRSFLNEIFEATVVDHHCKVSHRKAKRFQRNHFFLRLSTRHWEYWLKISTSSVTWSHSHVGQKTLSDERETPKTWSATHSEFHLIKRTLWLRCPIEAWLNRSGTAWFVFFNHRNFTKFSPQMQWLMWNVLWKVWRHRSLGVAAMLEKRKKFGSL